MLRLGEMLKERSSDALGTATLATTATEDADSIILFLRNIRKKRGISAAMAAVFVFDSNISGAL